MKRVLILLLALLMCMTALVGCGSTSDDGETDAVSVDTIDDGIGDYDFEEKTFTILTRDETSYEHVGEYEGESISQAVYKRNVAVSERFNVKIETVGLSGGWDSRDEFITTLRSEHMTSTGAYDLVSTHSVYLGWLGSEGILSDLSELPEVDLTQEYWNQNLYEKLNIEGSCYIMLGDIAHTLYEYISVMFVNTEILKDNQLVKGDMEGLYDMVDNGTWTWNELYELSKKYGSGMDDGTGSGDGKYGLLFNTHAMRAAMISQDADIYTRGADGRFEMKPSASEHLINSVENLSRFFGQSSNSYFYNDWGTAETELNPIFTSKSALFYGQTLGQSSNFSSNMGEGYAVLPLPKFDETQSEYYTICRNTVSGIAVMKVAKDQKMSGVITQALAFYGSEYVTPEYYERALKYRYASDPRCPEMLDKIRASLTIEPVLTFYDTSVDSDMFRDIIVSGSAEGVASKYETYSSSGNVELKNFYLQIEILKE